MLLLGHLYEQIYDAPTDRSNFEALRDQSWEYSPSYHIRKEIPDSSRKRDFGLKLARVSKAITSPRITSIG
jgi:hypothetical protein